MSSFIAAAGSAHSAIAMCLSVSDRRKTALLLVLSGTVVDSFYVLGLRALSVFRKCLIHTQNVIRGNKLIVRLRGKYSFDPKQ